MLLWIVEKLSTRKTRFAGGVPARVPTRDPAASR
jgi:hypothetical protein